MLSKAGCHKKCNCRYCESIYFSLFICLCYTVSSNAGCHKNLSKGCRQSLHIKWTISSLCMYTLKFLCSWIVWSLHSDVNCISPVNKCFPLNMKRYLGYCICMAFEYIVFPFYINSNIWLSYIYILMIISLTIIYLWSLSLQASVRSLSLCRGDTAIALRWKFQDLILDGGRWILRFFV